MALHQPLAPFYRPPVPKTVAETGLPDLAIEELIFKLLLTAGVLSGKEIAAHLCLPFQILDTLLLDLKNRLLLAYRASTGLGDFLYMLTEQGRERALMAREVCAYVGPAPVPFETYIQAMGAQSIRNERVSQEDLRQAFRDLVLTPQMFDTLGPAVNSGRGLFLYGAPGNGKTSVAERIGRVYRGNLFIPRALWLDGQILVLFDPEIHKPATQLPDGTPLPPFDARWAAIQRPVVIVGGELTLDSLEIKYNDLVKVSEAPLQMKANGGIFMIDDFGRQRIHHAELLNRWIVPLEKRIDYLSLATGKKIQVPFDELIIFSTNLNPADLVDEAFLRRIPYKIHVDSPNEALFRDLLRLETAKRGLDYDEDMVTYLIQRHYREKNRPFRACQARDLIDQVVHTCAYQGIPPALTPSLLDLACHNYFTAMEEAGAGNSAP
jgi:predicted ATPase with chaperone activity